MLAYLMVFLGGGLGSMVRFGISDLLSSDKSGFPVATFMANMLSCFILGYLLSKQINQEISKQMQFLLMTGFCGGFSTFSTFSAENYQLIQQGNYGLALFYVLTSLILGVVIISLGLWIGK